jgi:hypothetical protein
MSTLSLTRSPRYIRTSSLANATYFKLELYIFTGLTSDKPSDATYTLEKDVINSETQVTFEINQLIRDYYEHTFSGAYTNSTGYVLWAIADVTGYTSSSVGATVSTTFLAFDGFNYFQEPLANGGSINATYTLPILTSASKIQVLDTDFAQIPINAEIAETVNFKLAGATVSTHSITDSGNTNQKIQYITTTAANVDAVEVVYNSGGSTQSLTIEEVDECKHTVSKIVFINKYGALQNLYFFKKSVENLQINKDSFNRNILDETGFPFAVGFKFTEHQDKKFNIIANEAITLNSGFVSESMNDSFKELLLSQYVWMVRDGDTLPMNVEESSFTYKTGLNDKLINYTINLKYAFDTINNVH